MKKLLALAAVLSLLFLGCTNDTGADESARIDSKIFVSLKETVGQGYRNLVLKCRTEKLYDCTNKSVAYQIQHNGSLYTINFTQLIQPDSCGSGFASANASIELGSLTDGEYTLQFLMNESVLQSKLKVNGNSFTIENDSSAWVEFTSTHLQRIPVNAIWGHVGYSSNEYAVRAVQPFFDTLKTLGAVEQDFIPGDYSYFTISSDGTMSQPVNTGTENSKPFFYIYKNNILDLRNLIKYYGKSSPLSINLFTGKGDAFYTWQLAEEP